jgi:hypothetical protein
MADDLRVIGNEYEPVKKGLLLRTTVALENVTVERDRLRAEVERLRAEHESLRALSDEQDADLRLVLTSRAAAVREAAALRAGVEATVAQIDDLLEHGAFLSSDGPGLRDALLALLADS